MFGDLRERNPLELVIDINGTAVGFDAILHREKGRLLLVELELATGPRPFSFPNTYQAVRGSVAELNRACQPERALRHHRARRARAHRLRPVMVYRYDADYNGEVVAEAKRDDLNAFLGLHYPASDIPAQARALYEKNWLRIIDDVNYTPAPILPVDNPVTGRPIDLTHATLRSVSPIHIEYLKNMGVSASMSISLMRDGRAVGPDRLPPLRRSAPAAVRRPCRGGVPRLHAVAAAGRPGRGRRAADHGWRARPCSPRSSRRCRTSPSR